MPSSTTPDPIGTGRGGEPVRDDDDRAVLGEPVERELDDALGARIEARRGLVEHEDGGIGERGARQRHQLAFAARQARPALAHLGVEAHRERGEAFGDAERGDRGVDLCVGRVGTADPDVVAHGAGEEEALLRDDDDALPERVHRRVPQVDAAHRHCTAGAGRRSARSASPASTSRLRWDRRARAAPPAR